MKKLLILSVVALAATSSGCCRTWSSWWNRGSNCDQCVSGPVQMEAYSSGGALPNGTIITTPPNGAELLPGPAMGG